MIHHVTDFENQRIVPSETQGIVSDPLDKSTISNCKFVRIVSKPGEFGYQKSNAAKNEPVIRWRISAELTQHKLELNSTRTQLNYNSKTDLNGGSFYGLRRKIGRQFAL